MPGSPLGMNSVPILGHGKNGKHIARQAAAVNTSESQRADTKPNILLTGGNTCSNAFSRSHETAHSSKTNAAIDTLRNTAKTGFITSVSESNTSTAQANGTKTRWSSAHGSALFAYQAASASKPRWNQRAHTGTAGLRLLTDHRPARSGVSVNETNSEKSVATTITTPNSFMYLPTIPERNAIGKKTTTSTSVIVLAAWPISVRPL